MNLNWLSIIIYIFIILVIVNGFYKGLVKTAVSMLSVLLSIFLVSLVNPYIEDFLQEKTPVYERIQEVCQGQMIKGLEEQGSLDNQNQEQMIEQLPLPQALKNSLKENNHTSIQEGLPVHSFMTSLSASVADFILGCVSFFLTFIVVFILLRVLTAALDIIAHLPILNTFNHIGGGIAGGIQALLGIWILFIGVSVLWNTSWGHKLYLMIQQDSFLSFLYDSNILLYFLRINGLF